MNCHRSLRAAAVLLGFLGPVARAEAQSAEDLIRQMRELKNRDWYSHAPSSSPGNAGPTQAELDAAAAQARREKASALNREGVAAWDRGDWGIAGEKFQQAYAHNPDSKIILTNLAECRFQQGKVAWETGDWEHSAHCFRSAVLHQPESEEFKRWLAAAEQKVKEQRALIQEAREDRRRWDRAYALYEKGMQSLKDGNWAEAEMQFRAAAQAYPAEPAYRQNVAVAQGRQGKQAWDNDDPDLALAFFSAALETDPKNAYALRIVPKLIVYVRQEKERKIAAARTAGDTRTLSESLKAAPAAGGLDYDDGPTRTGAFGTRESNPTLKAVGPATPGTNTRAGDQLKSAAGTAAAGEDLTTNYDVGGARYAGSLVNPRKMSERVRNDPRMAASLRELGDLRTTRARVDAEREELIKKRGLAKDETEMKAVSEKLDQKEKEYQASLKALFDKEQAVHQLEEKVHREIDTEVVEDPATAPVKKD
ncbi:MAG: tetratricopeptide repeat protein [Planctomycetaceae bacterium]|nr:tetratricopeptide repeat protein [Planctomycetaceae bacterium]